MIHIKTWEIYKMALENPKSKFKRVSDGETYYFSNDGQLTKEPSGIFSTESYEEEWELVQEPVDFITAINSGKRVRSELWKSGDFVNTNIPKDSWHRVTTDEINGKWYIE